MFRHHRRHRHRRRGFSFFWFPWIFIGLAVLGKQFGSIVAALGLLVLSFWVLSKIFDASSARSTDQRQTIPRPIQRPTPPPRRVPIRQARPEVNPVNLPANCQSCGGPTHAAVKSLSGSIHCAFCNSELRYDKN